MILGPDNAFWDDGEWISWEDVTSEDIDEHSLLSKLEYEADLRLRFPNADITLIPYFEALVKLAAHYLVDTGRHLQVYGDIGELFGAITYGIKLNRNYAPGADGRLGNDHVEIKTITPFNKHDRVTVKLDGNFSKLLLVKINDSFCVSGKLIDRKALPRTKGGRVRVTWADVEG
ncbi:hypothetical protein [Tabrizicola sp.]|uniref:hypothetical protein n=1 Tax=Tabrizicola sp. TaxID=2005166 RepID=UPI0027343B53|nr:hypothetical protein [Tabrizicola sp.]MDP3195569.1 hypothetical protein [Tabrizicola sp.]